MLHVLSTFGFALWFAVCLFYTIQTLLGWSILFVNLFRHATPFKIQPTDAILLSIMWAILVFAHRL